MWHLNIIQWNRSTLERSVWLSKPKVFIWPMHGVKKHAHVKDWFKVQDRPMNFNVIVLKVYWYDFRFGIANKVYSVKF